MTRVGSGIIVGLLLGVVLLASADAATEAPLSVTHGIASGDVTATSSVIWARASRAARMSVEYTPVASPRWPAPVTPGPEVDVGSDFTGKVLLQSLAPDTTYLYWVRFESVDGATARSRTGRFKTAPADDAARPLTLVWWGDLGGQGYCRDPEHGYPLFVQMARLAPDLVVASGDSVYVDSTCVPVTTLPDHPRNAPSADPETAVHQMVRATDPSFTSAAEVLAAYRAKWKYNLEDDAYQRLRAQAPHVYQWDDHEVINDWFPGETHVGAIRGTADARPIRALIEPGRQSFFEFTPAPPHPAGRIYRSVRWGELAKIFVLDDRSYRDDNFLPDGVDKVLDVRLRNGERRRLEGKAKSLLGAEQRAWLLARLKDAQARGVVWKLIATDVPLSVASGAYQLFVPEGEMKPLYTIRDGWAAGRRLNADTDGNQANPLGFESELRQILGFLKAEAITNVVWFTTDVHHARILRYDPGDTLAGLVFHEFISGPVAAFSAPASPSTRSLSQRFRPVELYARGRSPDPARPSFFNFGVLRIAVDGTLTVEIRDADGAIPADDAGRPGSLVLKPR